MRAKEIFRNTVNKKILDLARRRKIVSQDSVIREINRDFTKNQKKILFCYLDYQYAMTSIRAGATHTNQPRFVQMLKCFIELDLIIDVCACNDEDAIKTLDFLEYDYIFGFGKVFNAACEKNQKAIKIIYMTEDPYYIAEAREKERMAYFKDRHGFWPPQEMVRYGMFYTKGQEENADVIICQGQREHFHHLNKPLYSIVPNAFYNNKFSLPDCKRGNKDFVLFGAAHHIRKGTDILVDVFVKHPEWKLHICEKNVGHALERLGYKKLPDNIIDEGFVDVRSDKLIDVFSKCTYLLLPSCTEAPGSAVLTGMRHGLIPIVMKGIGLDEFDNYCYYFNDFKVETVEKEISRVVNLPEEEILQRGYETYAFANEYFTMEQFTDSFRKIMKEIVCDN